MSHSESCRCCPQPRRASRSQHARSTPPTSPVPVTAWSVALTARSPRSDPQAFCSPSISRQSACCRWSSVLHVLTFTGDSLFDDHLHKTFYTLIHSDQEDRFQLHYHPGPSGHPSCSRRGAFLFALLPPSQ